MAITARLIVTNRLVMTWLRKQRTVHCRGSLDVVLWQWLSIRMADCDTKDFGKFGEDAYQRSVDIPDIELTGN
ncbi:MAG TPA: hypothetical protein DCP92_00060 [Nitrospiraceae bacterium]|nr:hypothetical protein [Nitrospiraceae bacterium]